MNEALNYLPIATENKETKSSQQLKKEAITNKQKITKSTIPQIKVMSMYEGVHRNNF